MSETLPDRNFHSVRAFAENRQARAAAKNSSGCFPSWRQGFAFSVLEDVGSGEISYFFLLGPRMLQDGNNCVVLLLPDCGAGRWGCALGALPLLRPKTNSVLHPKVPVSVVHRFACAQCRYNQFYPLLLHRENGGCRCCQTISRNGCSCRWKKRYGAGYGNSLVCLAKV